MVCPGLLGGPAKGLVGKIPDKTALIPGITADQVPVLLEVPHGIAHRMGVFTLDKRLGTVVLQIVFVP